MKRIESSLWVKVALLTLAALFAGCGKSSSNFSSTNVSNQTKLPAMPFDGRNPAIAVAGTDLYVLQGGPRDGMKMVPNRAAFFDSEKNQWKELPPLTEVLDMAVGRWTGKEFQVAGYVCQEPLPNPQTYENQCPRIIPTISVYNPIRRKWSSKSILHDLFPDKSDLTDLPADTGTKSTSIVGSYQDTTYFAVSGKEFGLRGDSSISVLPKMVTAMGGNSCQAGSMLMNIGVPESSYDADAFVMDTSPHGRLPRFNQLVMQGIDLAKTPLTVEQLDMPEKKVLQSGGNNIDSERIVPVCTSESVVLLSPNFGAVFVWDAVSQIWNSGKHEAPAIPPDLPFDRLALADVFVDQLITYQEQPEGMPLLIRYNPLTNELTRHALSLKTVNGQTPAHADAIVPIDGKVLVYQDLPGSSADEFTLLPLAVTDPRS